MLVAPPGELINFMTVHRSEPPCAEPDWRRNDWLASLSAVSLSDFPYILHRHTVSNVIPVAYAADSSWGCCAAWRDSDLQGSETYGQKEGEELQLYDLQGSGKAMAKSEAVSWELIGSGCRNFSSGQWERLKVGHQVPSTASTGHLNYTAVSGREAEATGFGHSTCGDSIFINCRALLLSVFLRLLEDNRSSIAGSDFADVDMALVLGYIGPSAYIPMDVAASYIISKTDPRPTLMFCIELQN